MSVERCEPALKPLNLTSIDAKMGVLMIHQNTSVFSIISQHLVKTNNIHVQEFLRIKAVKHHTVDWTVITQSPCVVLPHVIIVGFGDAPGCDENGWTP